MNKLLEEAIRLASRVHAGQVDKAGKPYILHPLRLMFKLNKEEEMIVAVLHDVIEDGDITLEQLYAFGYPHVVVNAIDCLTRRKNENYEDFIARIKPNDLARKVKIEDLKDNMDLTRLEIVGEKEQARVAKYHKALQILTSA